MAHEHRTDAYMLTKKRRHVMLHKADKRLDKKRSFELVEFCLVLDLFIAQSYDNDAEGCGFVNGPPNQTSRLHRI